MHIYHIPIFTIAIHEVHYKLMMNAFMLCTYLCIHGTVVILYLTSLNIWIEDETKEIMDCSCNASSRSCDNEVKDRISHAVGDVMRMTSDMALLKGTVLLSL